MERAMTTTMRVQERGRDGRWWSVQFNTSIQNHQKKESRIQFGSR